MEKKEFRKGKTIVRQGTHGTSAFILDEGTVQVCRVEDDGTKKVISILKEKDIFGEMGLIAGWPRTASVIALEDCVVSVLTRDDFKNLPQNNPGVKRILGIMKERLKQNNKQPGWLK